jgi:predicted PurR-regulated permease PerM
MTKFIQLGKRVQARRPRRRHRLGLAQINVVIVNIAILGILGLLVVGSVVQINDLATKGYQIKELEGQMAELKQTNKALEVQALGLQSMNTVKEKVSQLAMEPVGTADYLNPTNVVVATAR